MVGKVRDVLYWGYFESAKTKCANKQSWDIQSYRSLNNQFLKYCTQILMTYVNLILEEKSQTLCIANARVSGISQIVRGGFLETAKGSNLHLGDLALVCLGL